MIRLTRELDQLNSASSKIEYEIIQASAARRGRDRQGGASRHAHGQAPRRGDPRDDEHIVWPFTGEVLGAMSSATTA